MIFALLGCRDHVEASHLPSTDGLDATAPGVTARLLEGHESIVVVTFAVEAEGLGSVEYSFGDAVARSPARAVMPGEHEELLLGIPYDTDVVLHVEVGSYRSQEVAVRTGPYPEDAPRPELVASDPTRFDGATPYVLASTNEEPGFSSNRYWIYLVDREGRVVWAERGPRDRTVLYTRIAADGHALLVDHNSFYSTLDGGEESEVVALTLDGVEVDRWSTPGLHHAFTQLPDGTLAYPRLVPGTSLSYYDEDVVLQRSDGAVETLFQCRPWLEAQGVTDRSCGSNTVAYDAAADRLLVSWFSLDTITEHAVETGEVMGWFGSVAGSYAFDPPGSQFWYQHGAHLTEDGTLLVSTHRAPLDYQLLAREYEVDTERGVLRQVWSAGWVDALDGISFGEAHRLPGGNTLHNFGSTPRLREYAPDGAVVWELAWPDDHLLGRTTPINDLYELVSTH